LPAPAIQLSQVVKTYGGPFGKKVHALKGVQMRVEAGEIFGLLGPNGAGKSTLVKVLMTVVRPTVCEGEVLGEPVGRKRVLKRIGYLPEHHNFPGYLKGREILDFYGAMSGVLMGDRRRRIPELLELVGMREWADVPVRKYSKGMRQRIGLAQALMNDPDLVLLDEPTDGVDPVGRRDIRDTLIELKDRGVSVLINSHLLSELEMVCDRVAIMVHGKVAAQGTLDELAGGELQYEIELAGNPERAERALWQMFAGHLQRGKLPNGERIAVHGATLRVGTGDPMAVQPILDVLRRAQGVVKRMEPVKPSLEDLFIAAVEGKKKPPPNLHAGARMPKPASTDRSADRSVDRDQSRDASRDKTADLDESQRFDSDPDEGGPRRSAPPPPLHKPPHMPDPEPEDLEFDDDE